MYLIKDLYLEYVSNSYNPLTTKKSNLINGQKVLELTLYIDSKREHEELLEIISRHGEVPLRVYQNDLKLTHTPPKQKTSPKNNTTQTKT